MSVDEQREVQDWIARYFADQDPLPILITALLALQDRFGYLPKLGIREVALRLSMSPAAAFGVATFYNHFRFVPPGRYAVKVCMGTACHIKQASKMLDHWQRELGIAPGEVTADREHSLDRVACVGCCTLAPVTVINERVIGDTSPTKIDGLLGAHERERLERQRGDG